LLTTHLLDEAERLADRVAIIDQGRLLTVGTPQQIVEQAQIGQHATLRVTLPQTVDVGRLAQLPGLRDVRLAGPGVYLLDADEPAAAAATLTAWLRDEGVVLGELRIGGGSLEDVFLQLTGRELRE